MITKFKLDNMFTTMNIKFINIDIESTFFGGGGKMFIKINRNLEILKYGMITFFWDR